MDKRQESTAANPTRESDLLEVFRRATNIASMGVHVVDLETMEMYYSNEAGFRLIFQEPCDYSGRTCYEVFFGSDRPCSNCRLEETRQGATQHEVYVPEAGKTFLTNTELSTWNGRPVLVEYITDITQRKVAEEKQRQLLSQLEKVIHNVPGAVCLYQWNGVKLLPLIVSHKYSEMLGTDAAQALADTEGISFRHVHPDDLKGLQAAVLEGLRTTHKMDYTYRSMNEKTGQYIWINVQGNAIAEDGALFVYVTYTDVSMQELLKKTAAALDEAKRASAAKAEFFSRISHDMRTPMNGILGLAELSEAETELPILQKNIAKIKDSGQYLLNLINDTLDFQRIESSKLQLEPQVVNSSRILQSILDMVVPAAEKKHIDFRICNREAITDCMIRVDPVRIKQIFLNLLSNAVKFTPEGGAISVEYECLRREGLRSRDQFVIRDTGIGMSRDFLANGIFQPFSQEHNNVTQHLAGSGLGLSIVRSLVELMGGTISVESEPGVGTAFTLLLDFEQVNMEELVRNEDADIVQQKNMLRSLRGRRVLLAEDHPLNAEIAIKLLNRVGCEVSWAKNGKACVEMFAAAAPHRFDAVLMDIRMPILTGLEAARAIRALPREDARSTPILAMTANAYEEDVRQSLEAGMNAHLSKPIDPPSLYAALAQAITPAAK